MPFDVEGARSAGYTDDEILGHLTASRKFDVERALSDGYTQDDIIQHLSGRSTVATPTATPRKDVQFDDMLSLDQTGLMPRNVEQERESARFYGETVPSLPMRMKLATEKAMATIPNFLTALSVEATMGEQPVAAEGVTGMLPLTTEQQEARRAEMRADPEFARQQDVAAGIQQDLEAVRPENETFAGSVFGSVVESAPPMLAGVATGLVAGPVAGTVVGLGGGSLVEGGDAFQETGDVQHALRSAMYEAAGEAVGMHALFKGGKTFLHKMRDTVGANFGEEAATAFAQGVDRRVSQNSEMTIGDVLQDKQLWYEVLVGGTAGAVTGAAIRPVISLAETSRERALQNELDDITREATDEAFMRKRSSDAVARMLLEPDPVVPPGSYGQLEQPGQVGVNVPGYAPEIGSNAGATMQALDTYNTIQARVVLNGLDDETAETLATDLALKGITSEQLYSQKGYTSVYLGQDELGQRLHTQRIRDYDGIPVTYSTQAGNISEFSHKALAPNEVTIIQSGIKIIDEKRSQALGEIIKDWFQKISPESVPHVVVDVTPFSQYNSGFLAAAGHFSDGSLLIELHPNKAASSLRADVNSPEVWKAIIETAAHETFHHIGPMLLRRSSAEVQDAVMTAWKQDQRDALTLTPQEFNKRYRGLSWNLDLAEAADSRSLQELLDDPEIWQKYKNHVKYLLSFDEWLAHQGELYLAGDINKMLRPVRRYMREVYNAWRKLYADFKALFGDIPKPNDTFAKWVKYQQLLNEQARAGMPLPEGTWGQYHSVRAIGNETDLNSPTVTASLAGVEPEKVAKGMRRVFRKWFKSSPVNGDAFERELDNFGWWSKLSYTIIQVAKANPHIRELYSPLGWTTQGSDTVVHGYLDYIFGAQNLQMNWASRADETLRQWRKLDQKANEGLISMLFDQRAEGKYFDYADPEIIKKYNLTPESIEMAQKIDTMFKNFITSVEEARIAEAMKRLKKNPFAAKEIEAIRRQFEAMRKVPYVPEIRFGRYVVRVVARQDTVINGKTVKAGSTIERQHVERSTQQAVLVDELQRAYPSHIIKADVLPEGLESLVGMPRVVIESLRTELQLTEEQQKALDDYLYRTSPAASFAKRMIRRQGIKGFSFDLQRAFAQYFLHGAKHLSRIKYGPALQEAVKRIQETATAVDPNGPNLQDTVKRREIANYVARHYQHFTNPAEDWSAMRGAVALSYLGGMIRTAVMNLTQPMFTTYPELARTYGDKAAVDELYKAYRDSYKTYYALKPLTAQQEQIIDKWVSGQPLTSAEESFVSKWSGMEAPLRDALQRAQRENVIDQSQAMELAAMSEGNWMYRFRASSDLGYYIRTGAQALMIPFQLAEKLNRRVSFVAAWRLAKKAGDSDVVAYQKAIDAVRTTQFEYSKAFRPELLRGRKGLFMMFMQFSLSQLHFATNGYNSNVASWQWRWWALMLASGGLLGLPFAENLMDLAEWALVKAFPNRKIDVKYELKKLIKEFVDTTYVSPDAFLHGASRYGFGILPWADMSGSISMGRLVPGTDIPTKIATGIDWNDAVAQAVTDAGGATSTLVMRMLQGMASRDPDTWRRLERAAPMSMAQALSASFRWYARGGEQDSSGATIYSFDTNDPWQAAEIATKALGFAPRELNRAKDDIYTRRDFARFYAIRRDMLLDAMNDAYLYNDQHAKTQAMEAIRKFNKESPTRGYKITGDQIRESIRNRAIRREKIERGYGATRREEQLRREYEAGDL